MRKLLTLLLIIGSGALGYGQMTGVTIEKYPKGEFYHQHRRSKKVLPPKTFTTKVGNKKIAFYLNVDDLVIEAHSGTEVQIEALGLKPKNKRAEGLTPVYNSQIDNTGVGLNMETVGGVVAFRQAAGQRGVRYKVKIPRANNLYVQMGFSASLLTISGCAGEVEADLKTASLKLKDVQGPVVANTLSGNIEAEFSSINQSGPSFLKATSGFVDVTLPKSGKATISLKSITGNLYVSNPKIIDKEKIRRHKEENFFNGVKQAAYAKLNGGGVKFSMESVSNDVYLREK